MTYDTNGKPYFYNDIGRSVWELDEISIDEFSEADNAHFKKDFDEDLGTFNNIYNRLSLRKASASSESSQNLIQSEDQLKSPKNKSNQAFNYNTPSMISNNSQRVSTGINSNFKCVKLVEKGKKCK